MSRIQTINFSVKALEQLTPPVKGFDSYRDAKSYYLNLYITSKGIKTFYVRRQVNGRDKRLTIGRFPILSIEQARIKAMSYLSMIAEGQDPHEHRKQQLANRKTLGEHFDEYIERYSKVHKKTWAEDKRDIEKHCSHWFKRALSDITNAEVRQLHERLYADSGHCQANKILIRLRTIYNKAIEWGWKGSNPTDKIKRYKETSRDRFVQREELPFLNNALEGLENSTHKDYFKMLFLTGARKTNVRMMQWNEINWDKNEWRIPMTKNGDPLVIPLVPRAIDILTTRYSKQKTTWVFPHTYDKKKPMSEAKEVWRNALAKATIQKWREDTASASWMLQIQGKLKSVAEDVTMVKEIIQQAKKENIILPSSLMDIRLHDIRRTFGSYQAITGASLITIGKSLGHKSPDATKVYARLDTDIVRASIEKAVDAMYS